MTKVGAYIRIIDSALSCARRRDATVVLEAYRAIVTHDGTDDVKPKDHVHWIHGLSREQGVRVVPRELVGNLRNSLEMGEVVDDEAFEIVPFESFDPLLHAVLCTDLTVVSYMENNPDEILGKHARVIAPTLKKALLWWTTCE